MSHKCVQALLHLSGRARTPKLLINVRLCKISLLCGLCSSVTNLDMPASELPLLCDCHNKLPLAGSVA